MSDLASHFLGHDDSGAGDHSPQSKKVEEMNDSELNDEIEKLLSS